MEVKGGTAAAGTLSSAKQVMWRRLLIRDGLTFLSLTLVSVILGGVTTFLFRSFAAHRADLAVTWAERGRSALDHADAAQAVIAYRTSLTYRPDDRDNQLALAQALAASGHTNEAENYFLTLWDSAPGDGLINLQLARLERSRGDASAAINYYRAAVFGTWEGDAPVRRRDIRLELSRYQIERGEMRAARAELLIAAGNNADALTQLNIGEALEQANDPNDAMTAYRSAMQGGQEGEVADAKAGELCYRMGNYACAAELLDKALHYKGWTAEQVARMSGLQGNAITLQQLSFDREIPQPVRTMHLLEDVHRAQARLKACLGESSVPPTAEGVATLQPLQARWRELDSARNRKALRFDDDLQQQYGTLLNNTEDAVTGVCGVPQGDDALIVYVLKHPMTQFGVKE